QMQQQQAAFGRYYEELSGRGMFKAGDPVQPSKTATTVRVRNGSTKTAAGPATTGAEQIIGFYVVEAKNQDEAITYAAKVPSAAVATSVAGAITSCELPTELSAARRTRSSPVRPRPSSTSRTVAARRRLATNPM